MNARHPLTASLVFWAVLSATQLVGFSHAQTQGAGQQVPFVGCESDGQIGPHKAPLGTWKKVLAPADLAKGLAYYQAENGFGVLAPRGWHCFSTYGSSGSNLFVTPEVLDGAMLFSDAWRGLSGQAVQVSESVGDTSGRFAVARAIARVFPDQRAFVRAVIAEGIEPATSFSEGPYPTDKLAYHGKKVVEFETPPNSTGLGTDSMLRPNSSPIRGVAILSGKELSLIHASVRLSAQNRILVQTIIRQIESDVADSDGH